MEGVSGSGSGEKSHSNNAVAGREMCRNNVDGVDDQKASKLPASREKEGLLAEKRNTQKISNNPENLTDTGNNCDGNNLAPVDLVPPWRTCVALCSAFVFTYSAFEAIQNLQSSLNSKNHLGLLSLAILYLAVMLGSFLGPACARMVGHKNILLSCFVAQLCYTCSNFSPGWTTLIPVSAILGITVSGATMSRGVYIASMSTSYIHYKNLPQSRLYSVLSLFSGLFYSSFKATQITGNLMSSGILLSAKYNESKLRDNACGARICSDFDDSAKFEKPSKSYVNMLYGCYALCNIVGVLIIVFGLPHLKNVEETGLRDKRLYRVVREHIAGYFSMLLNPKFVILIPSTMSQAFMLMILYTGYTKAFVTCTIGVQWVGYCMVVLGIVSTITALIVSYVARYTGRIFQFVIGMGLDIITVIVMLLWEPAQGTSPVILMGIPLMAGVSEGILQPQIPALLASVFPKEQLPAVYAAMSGVKCLAFCVYLGVACVGCLYHDLALALALYLLAVLGYGYTELREWRRERQRDKKVTQ